MESTNKQKAKFFAQYYMQNVLSFQYHNVLSRNQSNAYWEAWKIAYGYLELKPLSSISDEDAMFIKNLFIKYYPKIEYHYHQKQALINCLTKDCRYYPEYYPQFILQLIDYLRSKSYALPWNDITVEQQVQMDWIKLT